MRIQCIGNVHKMHFCSTTKRVLVYVHEVHGRKFSGLFLSRDIEADIENQPVNGQANPCLRKSSM